MIWFGYVVIAILSCVLFTVAIAKSQEVGEEPDTEDWILASTLGILMAVFWPVSWFVYGVGMAAKKIYETGKVQ
jgi:hypothetical protein